MRTMLIASIVMFPMVAMATPGMFEHEKPMEHTENHEPEDLTLCQEWDLAARAQFARTYKFDKYLQKDAFEVAEAIFKLDDITTMQTTSNTTICEARVFYDPNKAEAMEKQRANNMPRNAGQNGENIAAIMNGITELGGVVYANWALVANLEDGFLIKYRITTHDNGKQLVYIVGDPVNQYLCDSGAHGDAHYKNCRR